MSNLVAVESPDPDDWLAKARWAASVFAEYRYLGKAVWVVRVTSSELFFNKASALLEHQMYAHAWGSQNDNGVMVHGGFGVYGYTAQEAYTIAKSLVGDQGDCS